MNLQSARAKEAACKAAERGIQSSADHAGPQWQEDGLVALRLFLRWNKKYWNGAPFTIESFRVWMVSRNLPQPEELRAFGALTQRAIREGLIRQDGFGRANSSNRSWKAMYRDARHDPDQAPITP